MEEISTKELENAVEAYLQKNLGTWLRQMQVMPTSSFGTTDFNLGHRVVRLEERSVEITERIVRVEEELKHLRKDMLEGFARVDKRFESMQEQIDKRFEQVDKRFESMQEQIDKRFEALTKRIDRFMIWSFGLTLTLGGVLMTGIRYWR